MKRNAYNLGDLTGEIRPTKTEYTFLGSKDSWDKTTSNANNAEDYSKSNNSVGSGVSSSGSSDKTTSKGQADKEYIEVEQNTLTGDLDVVPNAKTIKIKSGDTIVIMGVGKYLSGQYFVETITRRIDNSSGYSHSVSVLKTGYADGSLKGNVQNSTPEVQNTSEVNRPNLVQKEVPESANVIAGLTAQNIRIY